jgi:hypothetical protein
MNDVVGWTEKRVLEDLGRPDQRSPMARSPRREDGYFGPPGPPTITPETPYEMWYYHNVGASTWVLYLAQSPTGRSLFVARKARGVVYVWSYPTGAVF